MCSSNGERAAIFLDALTQGKNRMPGQKHWGHRFVVKAQKEKKEGDQETSKD